MNITFVTKAKLKTIWLKRNCPDLNINNTVDRVQFLSNVLGIFTI